MHYLNLDEWTIYYTTDDDGIWITDGVQDINLGHDPTIQDAIQAVDEAPDV